MSFASPDRATRGFARTARGAFLMAFVALALEAIVTTTPAASLSPAPSLGATSGALASPAPSPLPEPSFQPSPEAAAISLLAILIVFVAVIIVARRSRDSLTVGWYGMGARRDVDKHRSNW